jgi:D-alanyl-D-alanine carboxypeptidase
VACGLGCGGLDGFGGTTQSDWVAAHAWEHGFIVRYEDVGSPITGYAPEPWHLRYVGVDLAAAYHNGGFHTLEEFFGLPPAPGYVP